MPKIPKWSRRQDLENEKETPRVWQNDNTDALAQVRKREEGAVTEYIFEKDGRKIFKDRNIEQSAFLQRVYTWLDDHPYETVVDRKDEIHSELMDVGQEVEPESSGIANNLDEEEVQTIVATVDFFDPEGKATQQTFRDLTKSQYRVFDWLGMMLDTDWDSERLEWLFSKMAEIYIQEKDVDGFINQLRMRDLQVEQPKELRRV